MKKNDASLSKGIDWSLVWIYIILVCIGITAIFGVTYQEGEPILKSFLAFKTEYSKQFFFFCASLLVALFILLTDSKFFAATANLWYIVGIVLLLLVFPFHSNVKGTESIIKLPGGVQFQPAEFCKISVALALAKYLSLPETDFTKSRSQWIAAGIIFLPAVFSILQKEVGLALVFSSFLLVLYREGLSPTILIVGFAVAVLIIATLLLDKNLLAVILIAITGLAVYILRKQIKRQRSLMVLILMIGLGSVALQRFGVPFIFKHVLARHHVERIYSTLGKDVPAEYLKGTDATEPTVKRQNTADYNVKQSKIALGSGGILGKGLLKGTQTRYGFVPEQHTDFIFDTIGEGFGFVGSLVVLSIFLLLLFRIITIAERQRSVFSRCYAYGVASVIFFHVAINIAMATGLFPVIGITLPYISYGGTSLLTFTILLFILIRLDADRQMVIR